MKESMIAGVFFWLIAGNGFSVSAQSQREIELALVPAAGLSFSFFELTDGYSKRDWVYTQSLLGAKDSYLGLGLQAIYRNDWAVTASVSEAFMGGGYKSKFNSSWTAEVTFSSSLNFEKKLYTSKSFRVRKEKFSYRLNGLIGAGIYSIPPSDRVVEKGSSTQFGVHSKFTSTPVNYVSGLVNIGLTNQLLHNNKPRLKFGVLYSYGWMASRKFEYELTYLYADNAQEKFSVLTGKHRLLLYLEIPILLYRNKAQKACDGIK